MIACTTTTSQKNEKTFSENFKKVCFLSSGKGRIEFLKKKFVFDYETNLDLLKNQFQLSFDFPIVGEKVVTMSLNPKDTAKLLTRSGFVQQLKNEIGENEDQEKISNAIEEFVVLTSEIIQFQAKNKIPTHYQHQFNDGHFIMQRIHGGFIYTVDSFDLGESFFKRLVMKIQTESQNQNDSILTLYLVPEACAK